MAYRCGRPAISIIETDLLLLLLIDHSLKTLLIELKIAGRTAQCHADNAQVNLNFWVTPDESNTDLSRGGLVVLHTEPERRFEEDGGEYKHAPTKTVLSQAI